jgi:hypothetical protein
MTSRLPQLLSNEISLSNNGQSRLPGRQLQVLPRSIRVGKYVLNFYYREVSGCGHRHRFASIANQCRPANIPPPPPYKMANSTDNPIELCGHNRNSPLSGTATTAVPLGMVLAASQSLAAPAHSSLPAPPWELSSRP